MVIQMQRIVGPRVTHARYVGKLDGGGGDEPAIGDRREAAPRWLGAVHDPFVQCDAQGEAGLPERERVVQVLTEALGRGRRMDPRPAAVLAKTSDSHLAGAACLSLGLLKATKHARLVKERVLQSHRYNPETRGYAALGLALMGDTGNLDELRAMRERSDVRFGTQRILPLAMGILGGRGTNDSLIAMFAKGWKRREVYVSSSAAFAMGSIRDIGAVTELARLIEESPNPDVRGMAVIALGYTAGRDSVSPLTRCFTNLSYRNGYRWRLLYEISMIL